MTKTIQPGSWKTATDVTDNDLLLQKPKEKENKILIRTGINELINLNEMLNTLIELIEKINSLCIAKLPYLHENKKITQFVQEKKEGEKK